MNNPFARIWSNYQDARSKIDEDTRLSSWGRDEYKYIENDHAMIINAELGSNPSRIVYIESIKRWLPPYESEPVTEADRERILAKVEAYLQKHKITYRIE